MTSIPNAPTHRVVIVGAGPAGMATALELAQKGVPSTVLEKRGPVATRQPLFAVLPPFADRLAALDADGALTRLLTPLERIDNDDLVIGRRAERPFEGPLAPDAARSRGDMSALLRAADAPGKGDADRRRWSTVGIGELENAMRGLAATKYADLIDLRYDTAVEGVRQGDGWAEAVLPAAAGQAATTDAVRGAMLIDASGRNLLGSAKTVYPEQGHWIGASYPADGNQTVQRVFGPDDVDATPRLSVRLPSDDRRIVWTQTPGPARDLSPEEARAVMARRAPLVGVHEPPAAGAPTFPVTVQLSTTDSPADRRILAVGDSVRGVYFMTSTGGAAAVVHDAPKAVDAVMAVLGGADPAATANVYADAVRQANEGLLKLTRPTFLRDLGIKPRDAQPPVTVTP
ncbi:MAG: 3-(3-hydroxy-phenyl)propionate hydroxylase [Thermoleophilia bacterium]|nr:3-(3-hydroxy-phenyl)propionate hydroxylase [Thermoleophilia bacterium]